MARLKVGVLISGRGSNLHALIDACAASDYPAEIAVVIADREDVPGLERARRAGLPARAVSREAYPNRADFEVALDEALRAAGAELLCLAGFMQVLSGQFVETWGDRILNIHPSLLPAFPGLHTHERALDAGVRFSGCTVHFVRARIDDGPIVVQAAVPVLANDTVESVAGRVLAAEHLLYPLALKLVAEGRARIVGSRVEISAPRETDSAMFNPSG
jgi:phosphoribosylglycinamide formyltransferase 1